MRLPEPSSQCDESKRVQCTQGGRSTSDKAVPLAVERALSDRAVYVKARVAFLATSAARPPKQQLPLPVPPAADSPRGDDDDDGGGGLDDEESGLFADAVYDDEDREADEIYASVDRRLEAGRAAQRETRVAAELKRYREENPTIGQQFAGPKAGLAAVSYDEWAAVPDIGGLLCEKAETGEVHPGT